MRITNTSKKVINIGNIILLPDEGVDVNSIVANLPSVKALEKMELLAVDRNDYSDSPSHSEPSQGKTPVTTEVNQNDDSSADGLDKLTKEELLTKCKELGIEAKSNESKSSLIAKLREAAD